MELKLILLAIVISLYATEAAKDKGLGGADYLPCEYCNIPKDQYPKEGSMACYIVKRTTKTVLGKVENCRTIQVCDSTGLICRDETKCKTERKNVTVLDCELIPRVETKEVNQRNETYGTIYQINSPYYFHKYRDYPNNTYCIWNIADSGFVTYRIVDQRLQEPDICGGPGCDCPDNMKIKMGANEIKLCGSKMPPIVNQMSSDGLQVKFCSDNMHASKGILVMAYRHTRHNVTVGVLPNSIGNTVNRRRKQVKLPESCDDMRDMITNMSNNMSQMGCQYEFMMRMAQPGVPCPDDDTIVELVKTHDYMMAGYEQTMPMCDGMDDMTNRMPMMNSIESCAVDYLYRTRDCEFAKSLLDSTNGELNDVARMIAENNFPIKVPKWANVERTNCKRNE